MEWRLVVLCCGREQNGLSVWSGLRAAVMVLLVLCVAGVRVTDGLVCHCTECEPPKPSHIWGTCQTNGACYIKMIGPASSVQRGCLSKEESTAACDGDQSKSTITCCHSDRCNGRIQSGKLHLTRRLMQMETDDTHTSSATTEGTSANVSERTIAIITVSVCVFLVTVILAVIISMTVCCLYFYGGNRRTQTHTDVEVGHVVIGNCCSAIIPQSETISSLLRASHCPPNSAPSPSLSLLVQRAIVKNTRIETVLEQGQFCELNLGRWRREEVLVKVYSSKFESMWSSESQIHQILHMHHPHLLTFIAADYCLAHGILKHYLITEYHERGSLMDYLRNTVLDVGAVVVLSQSAASGLAHLHLEIKRLAVEKPSIVHRNITSKSFFVKNDGTCCLGDFSLALRESIDFAKELKGKPLCPVPYRSPELLDDSYQQEQQEVGSFEMLKKADVYALGLVMWEIARRCYVQGGIECAEVPYSSMISSEQASVEQMIKLVCIQKCRPPLAEHWNLDEMMRSCVQVLTDCWQDHPNLRPSAMTAKNSLDKLLPNLPVNKNTKISLLHRT